MNEDELDFRSFEEVLEDVLGIKNPRNILALKFQIKQTFECLISDMEKNYQNSNIFEIQKQRRLKELEEFLAEDDLEILLKRCIAIRDIYIQSYQEKIKLGDSDNVRKEKLRKIRAAHKVAFIAEKVPSLLDFMDGKINVLDYVDCEKPKIDFDKKLPKFSERGLLNPYNKLDIRFYHKPITFPEEYRRVLEDSGIFAYRFGGVRHSLLPNKDGKYTQEYDTKELVGIIKKDEFGKIQKYSILMDEFSYRIPPKFYRDILFSDMILRNSENNCGYLGGIKINREDSEYGYRICYDEINLDDFLRALYFNDRPEFVKTVSNFSKVESYTDARKVIIEKLENALNKLFADDEKSEKVVGDDD